MAKKIINVRHLEMGAVITIDGNEVKRVLDAGMRWNKERWRFEFFYVQNVENPSRVPKVQEQTVTIQDFQLTAE